MDKTSAFHKLNNHLIGATHIIICLCFFLGVRTESLNSSQFKSAIPSPRRHLPPTPPLLFLLLVITTLLAILASTELLSPISDMLRWNIDLLPWSCSESGLVPALLGIGRPVSTTEGFECSCQSKS